MISLAIEKMTKECRLANGKQNYSALVCIEEHYSSKMNDYIAECILQEGKTLTGAYNAIANYAKANKSNCVPDSEAFMITDEYFGIKQKTESKKEQFDILDLL